MNYAADAALFGWVPVVLALFFFLPARRAALIAFVAAWMLLPLRQYRIEGLPDYTKMLATCGGALLGIAIFDFRRLISLRLRWADIPIVLFCFSPFLSANVNGLGVHEGLSVIFSQTVAWGIPYAVGRLYFDELPFLRELAAGVYAGGLFYVPLCIYELVRGPELNRLVYGFYLPDLDKEPRFGVLRPMVFMESGLMLAIWMAVAAVAGIWLWKSRALPERLRRWSRWLLPVLILVTVDIRSVNGWIALVIGTGLLMLHSWKRSAAPLICVMVLICGYLSVRAAGVWSGEQLVPVVGKLLNPRRAQSIQYRLENENIVLGNTWQRPVFGWGRQRGVLDTRNGREAVWDSMWIITFGFFGITGLIALVGVLLAPVALFIHRYPANGWQEAAVAPAAALAVCLVLYALDNLANAMINPVFMLAAGGLSGLCGRAVRQVPRHG